MSQRTLVGVLVVVAILCAIIVISFSMRPAQGATCLSTPGISHGSVWWRWRYQNRRNGAKCWYPGSRYASRRVHSRPAQLRTNADDTTRPRADREPQPVEVRSARTVRTIQIYPGRTPSQRVERGFDGLVLFPIEDD